MSTEQNKAIVLRFFEKAFNQGNLAFMMILSPLILSTMHLLVTFAAMTACINSLPGCVPSES